MNLHHHRYYGITVFLAALIGLWGCSVAGLFELPDGHLYNGLVRLDPGGKAPAQVLLVETDRGQDNAQIYAELSQRLQGLGAARVIFTSLPEAGRGDFLRAIAEQPKVLIGRQLQGGLPGGSEQSLEPWPEGLAAVVSRSGLVAKPPAAFGLYRRQRAFFQVAGQSLPALERMAAAGAGIHPLPNAPYLVDFSGGVNRLPLVSAERVLAQGLIAELVKGRYVLIGAAAGALEPGFYTPAKASEGDITLLQYQGFALDSLLRGAVVVAAGPLTKMLVVLVIAVLCLFLYQNVSCRLSGGLTLLLLGLYLLVAWALLSFAGIWIPAKLSRAQATSR